MTTTADTSTFDKITNTTKSRPARQQQLIHQMWIHENKSDVLNGIPAKYNTDWYCKSFSKHNPGAVVKIWTWLNLVDLFVSKDCYNPSSATTATAATTRTVAKSRPPIKDSWIEFLSYTRLQHIERCDFYRLLVVYIHGGLYVDCDFHCLRNLDPLFEMMNENRGHRASSSSSNPLLVTLDVIDHTSFFGPVVTYLGLRKNTRTLFNGVFGARDPGNLFLAHLMDYIVEHYNPRQFVIDNTGPAAWTRCAEKLLKQTTNEMRVNREAAHLSMLNLVSNRLLLGAVPGQFGIDRNDDKLVAGINPFMITHWNDGSNWAFKSGDWLRVVPCITATVVLLLLLLLSFYWCIC